MESSIKEAAPFDGADPLPGPDLAREGATLRIAIMRTDRRGYGGTLQVTAAGTQNGPELGRVAVIDGLRSLIESVKEGRADFLWDASAPQPEKVS